jgi:hypothetical protein
MRSLLSAFLAVVILFLLSGCPDQNAYFVPQDADTGGDVDADGDADANDDGDAGPDPAVEIPECVNINAGDLAIDVDIVVPAQLVSADVFVLMDCTGSMREEHANIQSGLVGTIVPGTIAAIPDVRFGVGAFADFAESVYGNPEAGDLPFEMRQAITDDIGSVQSAIDGLPSWDGNDLPESQVEALYQVATGEGLGSWVTPMHECSSPGLGYPCFREGSQPVVVIVTDAPFHNGPDGVQPYMGITPTPHTFDEAMTALNALEARVIGIASQPDAVGPLEEVARRTGTVDRDDALLVYSISPDGTGLDETIVEGIESLARRVPLDVTATIEDVGGDELDATVLVQELVAARAEPTSGVSGIEGSAFYQALPGTTLTFTLRLDVSVIPVPDHTTLYPLMLSVRGNRVAKFLDAVISIEVPGRDDVDLCEG